MDSFRKDSVLPFHITETLKSWMKDDIPGFDPTFTTCDQPESSYLYMKQSGVLCGKPFVEKIFSELDCKVTWASNAIEGKYIAVLDEDNTSLLNGEIIETKGKKIIARIDGIGHNILTGERTALNLLSFCSGIATNCKKFRDIVESVGYTGRLAATRKTLPSLSLIQKYAVIVGNCDTHRMNLSTMVMIKDNLRDIWKNNNISFNEGFTQIKSLVGFTQKIEVECRSIKEANEAASAGADIIMLDNFSPIGLSEICLTLKNRYPNIIIEISGGIDSSNISHYAVPGVDVISLSALMSGVQVIDYSLKIMRKQSYA